MHRLTELEILQAALEGLDVGVYATDHEHKIVYWNRAAEKISGYLRGEVIGRSCKENLLMYCGKDAGNPCSKGCVLQSVPERAEPTPLFMCHKNGHRLQVYVKVVALRDEAGESAGVVEYFWPTDLNDQRRNHSVAESRLPREVLESRLRRMLMVAAGGGVPFGVLRLRLDQISSLQKTHGREACIAVMDVAEETLHGGLHPSDICGRWEQGEFLVITHVRTLAALKHHAQLLCSLSSSSDFRWWGDKVGLTLSIGGSMVVPGEAFEDVMLRVDQALQLSTKDGGNRVTMIDAKEKPCSQSSAS